MKNILFLNHPDEQCGVHQFGKYIASALQGSTAYKFLYREITTNEDVYSLIHSYSPVAIIFNWHSHVTMPNIDLHKISLSKIPLVGLLHEISEHNADFIFQINSVFNAFIVHELNLKTNRSNVLRTVRPILPYNNTQIVPENLQIGSIGFATPNKDYPGIVSYIQSQVDNCVIKFNIPNARFGDYDGTVARSVAEQCRNVLFKPGIELQITHDFLTQNQILDFLAANSLNIFFYKHEIYESGRGISSAVDLALASGRPIALNKHAMFRHLFDVRPSIFVDDLPLMEIAENGNSSLEDVRNTWTFDRLIADYDNFIHSLVDKNHE